MNKNIIIAAIIIVVLAAGAWWFFSMNQAQEAVNQPNTQAENVDNQDQNNDDGIDVSVDVVIPKTHEVVYTDGGFAPATLAIKKGDTVVFKNQSSGNMWVGSAMHPTHMVYSGTSLQDHCPDANNDALDQCANNVNGESWSFTFAKVGEWGYHNHSVANKFGKIMVTE